MSRDVSVVMAVHDARETVVRAVRSVLDQTHAGLELILVDDASTDGSVDVVRAHLDEHGPDDRVRYLAHEQNRGAAAARNTGVAAAGGEFICFVDSDDELLGTYLETLLAAVGDGVDIVVGNVVYVRPDGTRQERRPAVTGDFPGRRAAELGLLDKITPFTCDKLLRRTLYTGVRYPEGLINEDFLINPVLAAAARTVRVIDRPVYLYHVRAGSVTWGRTPPAAELDSAEHFLRSALLAPPADAALRRAVDHAVVFLTVSSAQRALLKRPATAHDAQVVREYRRRLRWRTLARIARPAPVTVAAAALLKLSPRLYKRLYSRYVADRYGQAA